MRQAALTWKVPLAVFSLVLTVLVWTQGLQESFNRPSVTPKLSIHQQEIALLAAPVIPNSLRTVFVGTEPELVLKKTLQEIPLGQLKDRERLVLSALEPSLNKRSALLEPSLKDLSLLPFQNALLENLERKSFPLEVINDLGDAQQDPLLFRLTCLALSDQDAKCVDEVVSKGMAIRLIFSQSLPLVATLLGCGLLIRQIWLFLKKSTLPWPQLLPLPLSLIDMVILVAGGFVLLGEVIFPTFVLPLTEFLTKQFSRPLGDSLKVFVGYIAMMTPPLMILRQQLKGLDKSERPQDGWLQWRLIPLDQAIMKATRGWLMVMPIVLLTGWLMNLLVGDQGGSNPLLELVLGSHDSFALTLLLITTVVLAPFFEEVIFRGALLPVLVKELGRAWGLIISALVFALAHLSVGELAPLFVLGLGLALLRLSSGRLLPCIFMHSLWNGITFTNLLLLGG